MRTDILIQALREAFDKAINDAVDARLTGLLQSYANTTAQFVTDIDNLKQRVAALELRLSLNSEVSKIKELIDKKIEEALGAHTNTYDHNEYDRIVGEVDDFDLDNIVTIRNLQDEVRDALRQASFSVEVSL